MPSVHREVERKYAADADTALPSTARLVAALPAGAVDGGANVSEGGTARHRLSATYFDTADLRLAAAGVTLRRRTGGDDAGWHLKVPAEGGARAEVRLPLGRATKTVPARLRRMVWSQVRGAPLEPVATIDTDRTVRRLVDATGRVLVELADDLVTAHRLLPLEGADRAVGAATSWREVEVELVDGDEGLLDALDTVLRDVGLRDAPASSKLRQLLGVRDDDRATRPGPRLRRSSPAGDVVLAYLREQVAQVRRQDLPVRLDTPGSVHRMRVATRRLRSALSTFGPLFDAGTAGPLGDELRWLAAELGTVRDAEVMRDRLATAVAEEDGAAVDVRAQLGGAYRAAHGRLLEQLDGDRYRSLVEALDALVDDPPLTSQAASAARKVLPRRVRRAYRTLRRRMDRAAAAASEDERRTLLHAARKAAKRARYAGEAVSVVFDDDAVAFAGAMEELQEVLGEHQDSVLTRERLRRLADTAPSTATAFVYGRLHALEELHGERTVQAVDGVWSAARRRSLRRWLG